MRIALIFNFSGRENMSLASTYQESPDEDGDHLMDYARYSVLFNRWCYDDDWFEGDELKFLKRVQI